MRPTISSIYKISLLTSLMNSEIMYAIAIVTYTLHFASQLMLVGINCGAGWNLPDNPGSAGSFRLPLHGRDLLCGVGAPAPQAGRLWGVGRGGGRRVVICLACAGSKRARGSRYAGS